MKSMEKAMEQADLNSLCQLAAAGEYAWLIENLSDPFYGAGGTSLPGPQQDFQRAIDDLRCSLAGVPEIRHLFELFLLTRYLLVPDRAPDWAASCLDRCVETKRFFAGVDDWRRLAGRLCAVPVVSVCGEACIRYFITGLVEKSVTAGPWPPWAALLLDNEAQNAVRRAADAAQSYGPFPSSHAFYCFPLTIANGQCQFSGPSLGLALAIGFLTASTGRSLSGRLLATGSITGSGAVKPVGSLTSKLQGARRGKFSVFLHPHQDPVELAPRDVQVIPVADLSEAWLIASLYTLDRGHELHILLQMLRAPAVFVSHMENVDAAWIRWTHRQNLWRQVAAAIVDSAELLPIFVEKLLRLLDGWNLEAVEALTSMISPDLFERMQATSPLAAFRFCTVNLALNNHRGNVAAADRWEADGMELFPCALKADIDACADFLNNRFVSRHNRYVFEPELPEEVSNLLDCLEKRYALQCDAGCFTDPVLGGLCGTIAQNFAFCGPRYLAAFEDHARRAMRAFGDGQVPEYRGDYLRQLGYLVYARLDAGRSDEAHRALFDYLEAEDWQDLFRYAVEYGLSSWQHAVLARFLADADLPEESGIYFNQVRSAVPAMVRGEHPWQLWLYNLGRIAEKLGFEDEAGQMYQKSLEMCLSDAFGPTVRVMALMPLTRSYRIGRIGPAGDLETVAGKVTAAAEELNPRYFRILKKSRNKNFLGLLAKRPETLFPFSYR